MIHCCSSRTTAKITSILTGLFLLTVALLCLWWTAGDWWVATPRLSRWYLATFVMTCFCVLLGWTWSRSRTSSKKLPLRQPPTDVLFDRAHDTHVLVIYASETGFAESLAQQTCARLQGLGCQIRLAPIDDVTCEQLVAAKQALFIASTAGQGDPPDHAIEFSESVMQRSVSLDSLQFGVLALGDRSYDEFCAFGHQLANWLRVCGGNALFDVIEVDDGDAVALQRWDCCIESILQSNLLKE